MVVTKGLDSTIHETRERLLFLDASKDWVEVGVNAIIDWISKVEVVQLMLSKHLTLCNDFKKILD